MNKISFAGRMCFFFFLGLMAHTAYADFFIEESITTNITGKILKGRKKTYITKSKTLLIDPTYSAKALFDYNDNKVFLINDLKKDIVVHSLNGFNLPAGKVYNDFTDLKERDIFFKKSDRKRKIIQNDCYEFVIYIPRISALSKIWVTDKPGIEMAPYYSFIENSSRDMQLKKIIQILKSNNSLVVESITTIVRPKEPERYLKVELLNISLEKIPYDLFILPEGYRIIRDTE